MSDFENGDVCIWKGKEYTFISVMPGAYWGTAVIFDEEVELLKQVPIESLTKPLSSDELSGKALWEMYAEAFDSKGSVEWEDLTSEGRMAWIKLAGKVEIK